jgi:hypothetical protein
MSSKQKIGQRDRGAYYTPSWITDDIAQEAIDARLLDLLAQKGHTRYGSMEEALKDPSTKTQKILSEALTKITLLDPACGDGAFLVSCLQHLAHLREGSSKHANKSRKSHKSSEVYKVIATQNLWGVDLDQKAVVRCRKTLAKVAGLGVKAAKALDERILLGNSLFGFIKVPPEANTDPDRAYLDFLAKSIDTPYVVELRAQHLFHWSKELPKVIGKGGFDIIVGNPPYGDAALSKGERAAIRASYSLGTTSSDEHGKGSANPSAVFIERCYDLLSDGGQLALVLPSSITRVREFQRTRRFLMDRMAPWNIIDEGSPFKGVTLEMVTLFAKKGPPPEDFEVTIAMRRTQGKAGPAPWKVPASVFRRYDRFMLYWDDLFEKTSAGTAPGFLAGRRGPTLPKELCSKRHDKTHPVPTLVSGKAVQAYRLVQSEFTWSKEEVLSSPEAKTIIGSTSLIGARLMDHYRVCVKPKGLMVGDNIVRLDFDQVKATPEALCVILNSSLMHYIVRRYLFNDSRLTMFMQSVTEATPIKIPTDLGLYINLGKLLLALGQGWPATRSVMESLDRHTADPLVYELYFSDGDSSLADTLSPLLQQVLHRSKALPEAQAHELLTAITEDTKIKTSVERIREIPLVKRIEGALAIWARGF